jgi:Mce-associated membrane protein
VAVPPASGDEPPVTDDVETSTPRPPDRTSRLRRAAVPVLVVSALLIVASLVSLAFLAVSRPEDGASLGQRVDAVFGQADEDVRERESAMSQAEQFVLRVHTYGPQLLDEKNAMPKYRELVTEVMTPKFGADFEEQAGLAEATVAQAGVARTAEVFSYGTATIDRDSASILVAGSFSTSYPDPKAPEDAGSRIDTDAIPFRYEVSLKKIDGEWLVDAFQDLTGEPAQPAVPEQPQPSTPDETVSP